MALNRALSACGHAVSLHDSGRFRCASDAPLADLVCICGGDGTVRMVLDSQSDLSALPPLAIYPLGTINLLARELGYPGDPAQFARRISGEGNRCLSRVAKAGGQTFLACASVGADALAVAGVSLRLKARIGRLAYVVALLRLLARWPRTTLRVAAEEGEFDAEAVFIMRGRHYAGPWSLDREAGLGQDLLHVLVLPRARRRDMAGLAWHALTGARRPRPDWRMLRTAQLRVSSAAAVPVQADGDVVASPPLDFRLTGHKIAWK